MSWIITHWFYHAIQEQSSTDTLSNVHDSKILFLYQDTLRHSREGVCLEDGRHGPTHFVEAHGTEFIYFAGVLWTRHRSPSVHMGPEPSRLFEHLWVLLILRGRDTQQQKKEERERGREKQRERERKRQMEEVEGGGERERIKRKRKDRGRKCHWLKSQQDRSLHPIKLSIAVSSEGNKATEWDQR